MDATELSSSTHHWTMEKKGKVTTKLIVLNFLLFAFLLINTLILGSIVFFNAHVMIVLYVLFSTPIFIILCPLYFILGRRDISVVDKLLPCIPTAAFIWLFFQQKEAVIPVVMVISGLSCIALVVLTVGKLVSN